MVTATRGHLWGLVVGGSVLVAIAFRLTGLSVAWSTGAPYLAMIGLIAGVAALRVRLTDARQLRLADLIELLGLFCWVSALGGLGSYAVAAASHGFHDAALAKIDIAMGFDWVRMYRFFLDHPWLMAISAPVYRTIFVTPLIVIAALVLTGNVARARTFILVFGISLLLSLAIFYLFPARAALAYHIGSGARYATVTEGVTGAIIDSLRAGTLTIIDPARIAGLLSFPSFHATSAVLFVWAGWPLKGARIPLIIVNGAMLAATPLEGAHYMIDLIGGIAIACAFIASLYVRSSARAAADIERSGREVRAV